MTFSYVFYCSVTGHLFDVRWFWTFATRHALKPKAKPRQWVPSNVPGLGGAVEGVEGGWRGLRGCTGSNLVKNEGNSPRNDLMLEKSVKYHSNGELPRAVIGDVVQYRWWINRDGPWIDEIACSSVAGHRNMNRKDDLSGLYYGLYYVRRKFRN